METRSFLMIAGCLIAEGIVMVGLSLMPVAMLAMCLMG